MADPYIGHDSHCIASREDSYASGDSGTFHHFGVFQAFEPADSKERLRPRDGSSRDIVVTETLGESHGGEVTYLLQDARALEFVMGTYTEDSTGPPYNHTLTGAANDIPSLKVEVFQDGSTDNVRTYTGCKVSSVTVSGSARSPIEVNLAFLAQTLAIGTSATATPSRISDDIFTYQHVVTISFNGSNITDNVPEFEFTIDNGLEERPQHGSTKTAEPIPLNRSYSGSLTIEASDNTFYNAFQNDTNGNLVFTLRRTASSDEIIFTFAGVEFDNPGGSVNVEELSSMELEWMAKSLTIQVNTTTQNYEWA